MHHSEANRREPEAFAAALTDATGGLGLHLDAAHVATMWRHFERLREANRRVNLTRITDPDAAAVRHYADSLAVVAWEARASGAAPRGSARQSGHGPLARDDGLGTPLAVLDVGSGAGFPSIPVAVVRPDWRITALEATAKKVRFIASAAAELGLANVTAIHAHSDHWPDPPGRFDLICFRAVGPLAANLRTAAGLLAPGGCIVAYKNATLTDEELAAARRSWAEYGLAAPTPWPYHLPPTILPGRRALWIVRRAPA